MSRRVDRILSLIENFLVALALAVASLIVIVNVVLRYTLDYSIFWAEEATVYLIIFSTFIGAAINLRYSEHVNMDILYGLVGTRGKTALSLLATLVTAVYCAIFAGYGWLLITEPSSQNTDTASLGVPVWTVQLAVPLGLTLMFARSLQRLYKTAQGQDTFREGEDDLQGGGL